MPPCSVCEGREGEVSGPVIGAGLVNQQAELGRNLCHGLGACWSVDRATVRACSLHLDSHCQRQEVTSVGEDVGKRGPCVLPAGMRDSGEIARRVLKTGNADGTQQSHLWACGLDRKSSVSERRAHTGPQRLINRSHTPVSRERDGAPPDVGVPLGPIEGGHAGTGHSVEGHWRHGAE